MTIIDPHFDLAWDTRSLDQKEREAYLRGRLAFDRGALRVLCFAASRREADNYFAGYDDAGRDFRAVWNCLRKEMVSSCRARARSLTLAGHKGRFDALETMITWGSLAVMGATIATMARANAVQPKWLGLV